MDSNSDELIETIAEELLQDDDYYQCLATPLKSAALYKQAHRNQLIELFQFKKQNERIIHALDLITNMMPSFTSADGYAKVKEEMDNSSAYFSRFMESAGAEPSDKPILLQEMLGLSDETLLHIYAFGRALVEKGNTQDACALFTLLTILAPHVESYWISQGVCMQDSGLHEEAIAAFNAAKFLDPLDPAPIVYSIESFRLLKDETQEKTEMELLERALESLDKREQATWRERLAT
jgi:tetratricopeptide (TPR) repeat protein